MGSIPIDRFSLYGKIGLYRAESEFTGSVGALVGSPDESTIDLTFGVGVRYDFTRNLGVRAQWQRYSGVEASLFGEEDVDVMSIGLIWRF